VGLDRLSEMVLDPGIPPAAVYAVVFLSCVLESFFPPWPTDLISVYAGFLAGRGRLDHRLVLGAAVAGTQVGVMATFWLGRRFGHALLAGRLGRWLRAERLAHLERWFDRYGAPAIAISRFFPAIRALVMPAAGLAGFSAWKVLLWAGTSVIVWNVLVVGLGVLAGTHLEWAKQVLVRYNMIAGLVLLAGAGVGAFVLFRRARVRRSASP
jgi:membrane protein DedA with SNARE-associated domain